MNPASRIPTLLSLVGVALAGDAGADEHVYFTREYAVAATGMCRAATYDAGRGLRYRPIGIYNAGSAPVDISCALRSESVDDYDIRATFYNYNADATTVTCAVLSGAREAPGQTYVRNASVSVPAGGTATLSEYAGWVANNHFASLSCRVPAGVEMGSIVANGFCYYGCSY